MEPGALSNIDTAIILGFLFLVVGVGYYMSTVASEGIEDYFLGKNKIPWWILGISTATSNFDMTGTMIIVALIYDLGYRGFLVEFRGGVGIALAFLMVFLGKWLRRSRVMTSAQFMKVRFGTDKQGKAAHILSAVAQSLLSLGMIVYFCVGGGKFLEFFLPWDKDVCTAVMVAVGLFYTLLAGLYGVVFTDVIQMIILGFTAIYFAVKGFNIDLSSLASAGHLPSSWLNLDFTVPDQLSQRVMGDLQSSLSHQEVLAAGANSDLANAAQNMILKTQAKISGYETLFEFFTILIFFYLIKGMLEGMSGIGGYTDQRFFAARNEREAGFLTLESILISVLRWAMVAGLVALGIHMVIYDLPQYQTAIAHIKADSEMVLPAVIGAILPVGIKGFVLAGLIAAAMSTFDSTLNAGASYLVVDIYQTYINPKATMKELVRASHVATIALAVLGVMIAALIPNIDPIWDFVTMALGAGMFMPLFLRWYWPRYNGWGFAYGTAAGVISAMAIKLAPLVGFQIIPLYISFPTILFISFMVSVVASFWTEPVKQEVLLDFWLKVNPGGLWKPYAQIAQEQGLVTKEERYERVIETLNDIIASCLSLPFQITVLLATMALIFHDWSNFFGFSIVATFCAIGLYFFFIKNLKTEKQCQEDEKRFGGVKNI